MIAEIVHRIHAKKLSPVKRVEKIISEIGSDPLHAFLFLPSRESFHKNLSPTLPSQKKLAGVVVAVKDNICVRDMPCTAASRMLENFIPFYDATVVAKIKSEGGIIIGKTNLDEFAMGSSTEYSAFGPTKNPLDPNVVPGGSGGGSAVAVAAGFADIALGSDTGGSVRLPAAFTGTVGFKPSYGVLSRFGLIAFASSLDQIGIHAQTAEDVYYILKIIAEKDPMDSTSIHPEKQKMSRENSRPIALGVPDNLVNHSWDFPTRNEFRMVLHKLKETGIRIVPVHFKNWYLYLRSYYIIASAEAASNLARYDGVRYGFSLPPTTEFHHWIAENRTAGFGKEVKRRILMGNYVLSRKYYQKFYQKAMLIRQELIQHLNYLFQQVDAIVTPTSPFYPFAFGERKNKPEKMLETDIFTVPANLAYLPAISIPVKIDSNAFPLGLHLMGPYTSDFVLLRMAKEIQGYLNGT
jgi:aspartyl-tRNA(Asn)/glutamyl-tRNA(Gln) amidotransferase subunit A